MTVALNHRITGEGPPLILLHGLFGSLDNLGGIARRLEDQWQIHALDERNHGSSPHTDTMDYPAMAADVIAYMDAQALDKVSLLGHSMGGKVAMQVALQAPERVEKLIVADIAPVDDSAPSMVLSSETIEVFDPYSLPACVTAICVQDFRITEPPGQLVIDEDAAASPMSGDDVYEDAVASPLSGDDVTMFQCGGDLDVDTETNLRPRAFGDSQSPVQHLTTFQDPGQI